MTAFKFQSEYVAAPRAVAEKYWSQPWSDVKAAAERGEDGLRVTGRPRFWGGTKQNGAPAEPDMAFLAEGQERFIGKTVLFQQNW